jgi:hypothetical protein
VFGGGDEKWFLTLREEYKLQDFTNKIRKIFGLRRMK